MMRFLFSDDVRRDPYPWYAELRRAAPVHRDRTTGAWMLFAYDDVKRALNDSAAFSSIVAPPTSRPGKWLIFTDPPRHTKLRALITRAFTPRAIAALEPRVRELARALLARTAGADEVELLGAFSVPLPLMVIAELLGAPIADWPRFRRWSDGIVTLVNTLSGGAEAERAIADFLAAHDAMARYLAALIEARRTTPADDLLTRLVEAEVDGERLDDDALLGFFQLLLLAGHETTTNLVDNAVLALIEHPGELARLRAAPELIPSAIEEVLRHRSPVQAAFRVARSDVELSGRTVPAGALVIAMIGSANRDPARFPEPDRFDVARQPNGHIAFGHGVHHCIGTALARLEARVALQEFLAYAREFVPATSEPWEPRAAFHVHGPMRLPLRIARADAAAPAPRLTIGARGLDGGD